MSVSVIIPCKNQARYLGAALSSAFAQTLRADEIIVINDGSTDDTREVAQAFDVRYLEVNFSSEARARTAGLAVARGDSVALLDADNELRADFIERHLESLRQDPSAGWSYSDTIVAREVGGDWYPDADGYRRSRAFSVDDIAVQNYIDTCSVIRREALASIGDSFPVEPYGADYAMWLELIEAGWTGAYVPEALFTYRIHSENLSAKHAPQNLGTPGPRQPLVDPIPDRIRDKYQRSRTFWQERPGELAVGCRWDVHSTDRLGKMAARLRLSTKGRTDGPRDIRAVVDLSGSGFEVQSISPADNAACMWAGSVLEKDAALCLLRLPPSGSDRERAVDVDVLLARTSRHSHETGDISAVAWWLAPDGLRSSDRATISSPL